LVKVREAEKAVEKEEVEGVAPAKVAKTEAHSAESMVAAGTDSAEAVGFRAACWEMRLA